MLSILAAIFGSALIGVSFTGSSDDDTIIGTQGDDTIDGGEGSDFIAGDDGDDLLMGSEDGDTIYAGDGDDTITDGSGRDELHGGAGHDVIINSNGRDDDAEGESRSDYLYGDEGNDLLINELGRAVSLDGGDGDDILVSDEFWTTYTGGEGSDYFVATTDLETSSIFPRPVYGIATDFNPDEDVLVVRLEDGDNPTDFGFREDASGRLELFVDNVYGGNVHMAFDGLSLGDLTYEDIVFISEADEQAFYESQGENGPTLPEELDNSAPIFTGTEEGDSISSYAGDTEQLGLGGDDTLSSFYGDATIDGGAGNDVISTGYGSQAVDGGAGDDTITHESFGVDRTEAGNDTLLGGAGDDSISGRGGDLYVEGGDGNDTISLRDRYDTSADFLTGAGDGTVFGGLGDDSITSYMASAVIDGGDGNDVLSIRDGEATVDAGLGMDTISIGEDVDGPVTLTDFSQGEDSLVIALPSGTALSADLLSFEELGGDLHIFAPLDGSTPTLVAILGGVTTATVTLTSGTETLSVSHEGEPSGPVSTTPTDGDDILTGGVETNFIHGYGGSDVIDGGAGENYLFGGEGDDLIINSGADDMTGGAGADTFVVGGGDYATIYDFNVAEDQLLVELSDEQDESNIVLQYDGSDTFVLVDQGTGLEPVAVVSGLSPADLGASSVEGVSSDALAGLIASHGSSTTV